MPKRLTDNLNSLYLGAANTLKPKNSRRKIVVYVESYDDILFWRNVLSTYENDSRYFEVMLPSRDSLTKGKKSAITNLLGESLGQNMIACVDADYDYLLQGATETSRRICNSPYIFHTYAYAIENYQCNARNLHEVCVMATLNDHELLNFSEFYRIYSEIVYPLFVWNVYFYRLHDLRTFPMLEFCNVARIDNISLQRPGKVLEDLERRVHRKLMELEKQFTDKMMAVEELKGELKKLGVLPENTYYFVQGHHVFENVTLKVLIPVCTVLRREREAEIKALAAHDRQLENELTCYQHSQSSVELMLKKNRAILDCEPFERLKADLEKFLSRI